jgi:hypothetical protein
MATEVRLLEMLMDMLLEVLLNTLLEMLLETGDMLDKHDDYISLETEDTAL